MARISEDLDKKRIVALVIFALVITVLAWQSDDAYHGYVMAKHLVEGDGFVYNIGQRASATTGPIYTLLIALAYAITHEMFFTSIFVNVAFSTAAAGIVFFGFCKTKEQLMVALAALTGCASFVSYTTSGLENCLLFFLSALFLKIYFSHERFDSRQMLGLALVFAFLATARMDAVLFFIPAIVYVYLMKRRDVSFPGACLLTLLGLLPFILWELFSVFYYGFWVPNTAFVKLGTDIGAIDYIKKGIWYIYYTVINDPAVCVIPGTFVVMAFITRKLKNIYPAIGVVLYGLYVIWIGGDFMLGRHFTVMYLISVAGIIHMTNELAGENFRLAGIYRSAFIAAVASCLIFSLTFGASVGKQYLVNGLYAPGAAISDERAYYSPTTGFFANVRSLIKDGRMCIEDTWNYQSTDEIRENGWRGNITDNAPGILVYYNSDLYLNDTYCLGDPFLSKLPAIKQEQWRIGHLKRAVPPGYRESVIGGTNVIEDKDLAEYYDIILKITEGELFSSDRIKTVIDWNLGKYDHLLDSYTSDL